MWPEVQSHHLIASRAEETGLTFEHDQAKMTNMESFKMEKCFEILEHPADLGIEARGANLAEAFESAAEGLMSLLVDPATVQPSETRHVELSASDAGQLLVKWLGEILYFFDGENFVSSKFAITRWSDDSLRAEVAGEKLNLSRHATRMDVKAITYHQLQVKQKQRGGKVRVYLDI